MGNVPAVSLYCNSIGHVNDVLASSIQNEGLSNETRELKTHQELFLKTRTEKRSEEINYGYFNISDETLEMLENIRQAIGQEKHSTHVITGLLTILVIVLTTFVLYLCFSRGISSMSKYVM